MSKLQILEDKILKNNFNYNLEISASLNDLYLKFINKTKKKRNILNQEVFRIDNDINKYNIQYENLCKSSDKINKFITSFIDELNKSNLDQKNKLKYLISLRNKTMLNLDKLNIRYEEKKKEEELNIENINKIKKQINDFDKTELDIENLLTNFKCYQDKTDKLLQLDIENINLNNLLEKENKQLNFLKEDNSNYENILSHLKQEKNNITNKYKWSNSNYIIESNNNNLNKINHINNQINNIKSKIIYLESEKDKVIPLDEPDFNSKILEIDKQIQEKSQVLNNILNLKKKEDTDSIEYIKLNKKYNILNLERNNLIKLNKKNNLLLSNQISKHNIKQKDKNNEINLLIKEEKEKIEILELNLTKLNNNLGNSNTQKTRLNAELLNLGKQEQDILQKKNDNTFKIKVKIQEISKLTDKIKNINNDKIKLENDILELKKRLPEKFNINLISKLERSYLEKKAQYEVFLSKNYSNEMSNSLLNTIIELRNFISYLNFSILTLEEEVLGLNDSITKKILINDKCKVESNFDNESSKLLDIIMDLKLKKKKILEDLDKLNFYIKDLDEKQTIISGIS